MWHIQAQLSFKTKDSLEPDEYYQMVWDYGKVGPYPPMCEQHSSPSNEDGFVWCQDLGRVTGVTRSDDRQVFITCIRQKFPPT